MGTLISVIQIPGARLADQSTGPILTGAVTPARNVSDYLMAKHYSMLVAIK